MLGAVFFLDSSISEHFGWFHVCNITNSAKINMEVRMVLIKTTHADEDVENAMLSLADFGNKN